MIAGLVAVGVILVGVPLLAWWVGGRPGWNRLSRTAPRNGYAEFLRRHRLKTAEIAVVEQAVRQGRELSDPRLRAAVVEAAQRHAPTVRPRWRSWLVVLFVAWLTAVTAHLVFLLVQGRWGEVDWSGVVWWVLGGGLVLRTRATARRAVRLNSGPPGGTAGGPAQRE